MRVIVLAAAAAVLLAGCQNPEPAAPAAPQGMTVAAAVADPARAADVPLDARRMPAELVALTTVKPGDKVADLIPGNGYFSRIFAKVVGPQGKVYLVWPDAYRKVSATDYGLSEALARSPAYGNLMVLNQPAAAFSAPEPLDVVFTSQNYHDYPDAFMGKLDPVALNRQVFAALKPGGVYVVVDHAAAAGSGLRDVDTLHRIDPETVKQQVTAAGFVLDGESEALANPADDHSLPVFDDKVRRHTDRFALRFRKPG